MSRKRKPPAKRSDSHSTAGTGAALSAKSPAGGTSSRLRNLILVVTVGVGVVLGLYAVSWYQERRLRQADVALREGRPQYAEILLTKFLSENPNHFRAMALQARTLVELNKPRDALKLFEVVGVASPEEEHALAKALAIVGRRSDAIAHLQLVLAEQPDNADAWHELTAILIQLGRLRDALETAEKYVALPGQEAQGRLFLGAIYTDLRNYELAVEQFAKLIEQDPGVGSLNVRAWEFFKMYGEVLLESHQVEKSIVFLRKALDSRRADGQSVSAQLWFLIGKAEDAAEHPEKAKQAWNEALRVDQQHLQTCEQLAKLAIADREFQKALEFLQPVEKHPELASSTAFLLQRTYSLLKDAENAEHWKVRAATLRKSEGRSKVIAKYLTDSPNSFWGQAMKAHHFAQQGERYEAEKNVRMLINQDEYKKEPFVAALWSSLTDPSKPLPSTDLIPIDSF